MNSDVKRSSDQARRRGEQSPFAHLKRSGSCLYRLYYSFVFFTRGRQPVLEQRIVESLGGFLQEVCTRYNYELIGFVAHPNQLQVVVNVKPIVTPAEIVSNLKRATAHLVFEHFPDLETRLGKRSLWGDGYLVDSISWRHVEALLRNMAKAASPAIAPVIPTTHEQSRSCETPKPRRLAPTVINELLEQLLPVEQQVLILLYGLRGERSRTHEEVGIVLNLQPHEVKQIEEISIRKLRDLSGEPDEPAAEVAHPGDKESWNKQPAMDTG